MRKKCAEENLRNGKTQSVLKHRVKLISSFWSSFGGVLNCNFIEVSSVNPYLHGLIEDRCRWLYSRMKITYLEEHVPVREPNETLSELQTPVFLQEI